MYTGRKTYIHDVSATISLVQVSDRAAQVVTRSQPAAAAQMRDGGEINRLHARVRASPVGSKSRRADQTDENKLRRLDRDRGKGTCSSSGPRNRLFLDQQTGLRQGVRASPEIFRIKQQ